MNIVIYESSSFGGCYDYSQQLLKAYAKELGVGQVELLLPSNSQSDIPEVRKILFSDKTDGYNKLQKKLLFILRVLLNPVLLFVHLLSKKACIVLLNDFEQLSACLWAPFFRLFLRKHKFAVFLHDPDRDEYPPSYWISALTMKCMMQTMHLAFYHELLPLKTYYQSARTKYIAVPHGIYPAPCSDPELKDDLKNKIEDRFCLAMVGNIREEKNVDLVIRSLCELKHVHLIIAGRAANSSVDINAYRRMALELGVKDRITWVERFLTEEELSAVIEIADAILLYYKATFASQSAIINLIAPFEKKLLVSNTESALTETVRKFKVGKIAKADDVLAFVKAVEELSAERNNDKETWTAYLEYASWEENAKIAISAFREL